MKASKGHPAIDLVELEKLCSLQCTQPEIASFFGVSTKAVEMRVLRNVRYPFKLDSGETVQLTFREIMQRGYDRGKISLRRAQFQAALAGNVTAQIWLGKQVLGQRDNLDLSGAVASPMDMRIQVVFVDCASPLPASTPVSFLPEPV